MNIFSKFLIYLKKLYKARKGGYLRLSINLPKDNRLSEFKAELILEKIRKLNIRNEDKKKICKIMVGDCKEK